MKSFDSMKKMEINTRAAVKADAAKVAELLVYAWPVEEFFALRPDLTLEDLRAVVTEIVAAEGTSYSYENSVVAEYEGEIVGAMCGYDGARCDELKLRVRQMLADRFYGGDVEAVNWSRETQDGEFYLDSIGVDPECRGMGIGTKLFAAMLERAWADGHSKAGLIVDMVRPEAEKLYNRLGFSFVNYMDFCGHRMKHMQIDLDTIKLS